MLITVDICSYQKKTDENGRKRKLTAEKWRNKIKTTVIFRFCQFYSVFISFLQFLSVFFSFYQFSSVFIIFFSFYQFSSVFISFFQFLSVFNSYLHLYAIINSFENIQNDFLLIDCKVDTVVVSKKDDRELLIRRRAFCPYCLKFISKFHVHLEIQHSNEAEVKLFINLNRNDKRRRWIISNIRHRGYGLQYERTKKIMPVSKQRGMLKSDSKPKQCPYCQGHYSGKSLWRHKHRCLGNPMNV